MKSRVIVPLGIGRNIDFEVDVEAGGPACMVLGIRKCGSSLLNQICERLAALNLRTFVDVAGRLFEENVLERDWLNDSAVCGVLRPGNVYGGFRNMPLAMAEHPVYRSAAKILMVRDPRDALVSEYFSNAYSHPIPARIEDGSNTRDLMTQLRREALTTAIDDVVVKRARDMLKSFLAYTEESKSTSTQVVTYEDYIFRKPALVRVIARQFGFVVSAAQVDEMMVKADIRPETEDPTAFVRRVTPGDHREKLRPKTIRILNRILEPALRHFGYPLQA